MRKSVMLLGISAALLTSLAVAKIDLGDFDDEVMRNMEDSTKYLDSDLATNDAKAARTDATAVKEGLKWAEDYFVKKGGADDAVNFAKHGQDSVDAILKALDANDFEKANTAHRDLVKTCRSCHEVYKST